MISFLALYSLLLNIFIVSLIYSSIQQGSLNMGLIKVNPLCNYDFIFCSLLACIRLYTIISTDGNFGEGCSFLFSQTQAQKLVYDEYLINNYCKIDKKKKEYAFLSMRWYFYVDFILSGNCNIYSKC